ncbi:nitrogen fixation protein NifHD [Methanofervidicoccus sp. A16]|uniref:P-II family nitrogen regulator n=1 Tax=Methanofervidicoccus sp. A16 TaxID=2607662 RepID=UPI00118CEF33|nr:P-II family nitrogen regulator [Methanofervidicoccus sp. A16]AXI24929.1 nitrogen fixation protein NifHD [Methanofervidicoccus sp. A16]
MKEVIAIINPNKVSKTAKALDAVGFPAVTIMECFGRGKQKGYFSVNMPEVVDIQKIIEEGEKEGRFIKYIPKRLLSIVVEDEDVPLVVGVISKVNRTGNFGDGKIFVLPVEEALRIRTGERGKDAIGN